MSVAYKVGAKIMCILCGKPYFRLCAVICLTPALAFALINPGFTPVELAEESKSIVYLQFNVSPDASTLTARTLDVLKGEDPGLTAIKVPFHLRTAIQDIVESDSITAVYAAGDFSSAAITGGGGQEGSAMLKTDAGWFGLYGTKQEYILGDDPLDLRTVWAGSSDMLVAALRYIFLDPARAEIPVKAGVKWSSAVAHEASLSNVSKLLPVLISKTDRLLLTASVDGDRVFAVGITGEVTEVTGDFGLSSRSMKAAWSDMNADGSPDLLSWNGKQLELHSLIGSRTKVIGSVAQSEPILSMSGAVLKSGGRPVVVAGTPAGPAVISFIGEKEGLLLSRLSNTQGEGGGPCVVADFTGDGLNDIAEIRRENVILYSGRADGHFQEAVKAAETYGASFESEPLVSDIDGDGRLDLMVCGADGAEPYLNLGDGTFLNMMPVAGELTYVGKPGVIGSSTADFNKDGRQEFILFYENMGPLPFFNRGFSCFGYASELEFRTSGFPAMESIMRGQQAGLTADIDGDGAQETIIVGPGGELVVLDLAGKRSRPDLSIEATLSPGMISPCRVNSTAQCQVMGARNASQAFPAFWGVRRKGPVKFSYKDAKGKSHQIEKIVLKPSVMMINPER